MKTIKRNVYYCEYCGKHGLSAGAMAKHEKHCTANPDRECRLCGNTEGYKDKIKEITSRYKLIEEETDLIPGFISIKVEWIGEKVTLGEINDIANGCPNCMLSIIRLSGLSAGWHDLDFDYKGSLEEYWLEEYWNEYNKKEFEREEELTYMEQQGY